MGKMGNYSRWFPKHNVKKPRVKQTKQTHQVGNQIAGNLFEEVGNIDIHVHNLYRCYLIAGSMPPEQARLFKSSKCMNPKMSLNVLHNKNRRVRFKA